VYLGISNQSNKEMTGKPLVVIHDFGAYKNNIKKGRITIILTQFILFQIGLLPFFKAPIFLPNT